MRFLFPDDSDDEREVSRKRTVRQAASKAVSKQREILLGDGGSEDEEHEDQEEPYLDRTYNSSLQHTPQSNSYSTNVLVCCIYKARCDSESSCSGRFIDFMES